MEIDVSHTQGRVPVVILKPHGHIDASNYALLIDKISKLTAGDPANVLLDLSDVSFISSAGLAAFRNIATMLQDDDPHKQHFKLLNPQPNVIRALKMIGYDTMIEAYTDMDEAVQSFG